MAKYYGKVGYAETVEVAPGDYNEQITELPYFGDVIRNTIRSTPSTDSTNRDFTVSVQISIVADPYATAHFSSLRFVEYMGSVWDIANAEPQFPRILLTLGGVYNGERATIAEEADRA